MGIPVNLLIHSCTYEQPTGKDRDGNITYGTPQTLEHVRFEAVEATEKSDIGETKDDRLTMFIDCETTAPAVVPAELAKVTWLENVYTIRSVTPRYTRGGVTVHHYEVALI